MQIFSVLLTLRLDQLWQLICLLKFTLIIQVRSFTLVERNKQPKGLTSIQVWLKLEITCSLELSAAQCLTIKGVKAEVLLGFLMQHS